MKISEVKNQETLDLLFKDKNVLGIDETGVGDYLTPLVAAVAIADNKKMDRINELGITDSKKLSDSRIKELAKIIQDEKLAKYKTAFISVKGYNNLAKRSNANLIKMFVHMKAYTDSQKGKGSTIKISDFDYVFIDQYSTLKAITGYFDHYFDEKTNPKANWPRFRKIGADIILSEKAESKHPSVAIASIMARNELLFRMEELNREWETTFPLGASTKTQDWINDFVKSRSEGDETAEKILRYNIVKNFNIKE
ncbi:ribonuclease HII [Mycoplasma testudineum]|uniref:Ribonuclease n=1 Tax=Mycoplasma testudineum TaxID=244584 RepID=A0A4R6IFQ1_9MOLU|nr:ribonuclease HIII [Mycoplasma testudineum]OYD27066.1 ribonuclease HIII [Mycoplasma testudineum]TDO21180.1 ribonuclease HII [Mycoplasma testudineum]